MCFGCQGWRATYPSRGTCRICGHRYIARNLDLVCRLCWRQAAMLRKPHQPLDYADANRHGQQLFFADMFTRHHSRAPRRPHSSSVGERRPSRITLPVSHRQLALLDLARDLTRGLTRGFPPPDPRVWALLEQAIDAHAAEHGWQPRTVEGVHRGMRILLGTQDTPGAPIRATNIDQLASIGLAARPVRDVLERIGMVDDDRIPAVEAWFRRQVADLPEPMRDELRVWFDVMLLGSTTPPRRHPRSPKTIRAVLAFALPALRAWAADHASLREITREQVLAILPPSGTPRATTLYGLRCMFTVLRARKLTFCNPAARIRGPRLGKPAPPAIDIARLRARLGSGDVTVAALAALIAFHALSSGQICALQLTDLHDGRLHLGQRHIPLAHPVRIRLRAYLDYRHDRWPATANPHLFIHYRTSTHTGPVTPRWVGVQLGMNPQHIRQDRILDEAHATGGDIRVLCDLFGLSVAGAYRYVTTVDHPGIAEFVDTQR